MCLTESISVLPCRTYRKFISNPNDGQLRKFRSSLLTFFFITMASLLFRPFISTSSSSIRGLLLLRASIPSSSQARTACVVVRTNNNGVVGSNSSSIVQHGVLARREQKHHQQKRWLAKSTLLTDGELQSALTKLKESMGGSPNQWEEVRMYVRLYQRARFKY